MSYLSKLRRCLPALGLSLFLAGSAYAQAVSPSEPGTKLLDLVAALRGKAKILESSTGMQYGFRTFTSAYGLKDTEVSYSDYVVVRLLFEATRDAGLWNLHWKITNRDPNSDNIWRQWKDVRSPSVLSPTAIAECDELSALYAFLVGRAGVRGMGLLWPYPNHTVAVWVLHPAKSSALRVVVPTTQIFLGENDFFGTKKFDPWRQKSIYEYTRRDVADTFTIPASLAEFFLKQIDKYAGASDLALQRLRYLREGVFLRAWTPEQAAIAAAKLRAALGPLGTEEDRAAYWNFAQDMRAQ